MTPEEQAALDNLVRAQGTATFADMWNSVSATVKAFYNALVAGAETSGRLQVTGELPQRQQQAESSKNAGDILQEMLLKENLWG